MKNSQANATVVELNHVSFTYQAGTPLAFQALADINLTIKAGSFTAIIGQTGSGKSTLLKHLNGLLRPTRGTLVVNGVKITPKTKQKQLGALRKHVGFVFQQPEKQLFEETVLKDIAFAPKNFGKSEQEAKAIALQKAKLVGLDENLLAKSPFELSGGQMRRVAIAGILALEPEVLILDEPTAGLDPSGRKALMTLFEKLHQSGMTIILVTHQMDDVAMFADDVVVLANGKLIAQTTPDALFNDEALMTTHHLKVPQAMAFAKQLQAKGVQFERLPLTLAQLSQQLATLWQKREENHE